MAWKNRTPSSYAWIGLFLFLTGFACNPWLLGLIFSSDGRIGSEGFKFLIFLFDVTAVFMGAVFLIKRNRLSVFKCGLFFWGLYLSLAAILILDSMVTLHHEQKRSRIQGHDCYNAFTRQYIHPYYYFFFPRDPKVIHSINNSVVSIDKNGFRGGGPELASDKKRRLAFVLGGSVAFGHGCSSDQNTISGYLNKIQSKYHFVNAGVPSWNSTQEFYRL